MGPSNFGSRAIDRFALPLEPSLCTLYNIHYTVYTVHSLGIRSLILNTISKPPISKPLFMSFEQYLKDRTKSPEVGE